MGYRRPWVWEVGPVVGLTVLAAFIRLTALDEAPPGLHGDEAWTGLEALRILRDGPIGVWSPSAFGQPAGPFYWTAVVLAVLEPTVAGVRTSAALMGVLTVPALYVFGRTLFGSRAALAAATLLTLGFWHIHYSRIAFPPVALPLVETAAFAALFLAFQRDRLWLYVIAGGLLGLGFHTYIPYPFVGLGVAAFLFVWAAAEVRAGGKLAAISQRLGLMGIAGLATAGPFLYHLAVSPEPYTGYAGTTLIPLMDVSLGEKVRLLFVRTGIVLSAPFMGREVDYTDGLGDSALLDPLTGMFLLVGLGAVLARPHDRRSWFVLITLGASLVPAVLTSTNWGENRRIIGALPLIYLLGGIGLVTLIDAARAAWPRVRPWAAPVTAVALVAVIGVFNLHHFFNDYAHADTTRWVYAEELAAACQWMEAEGQGRTVYFYSARWSATYETCRFLAPSVAMRAENRSHEFGTFTLEKDAAGPVLYVLLPPYTEEADKLRSLHPNGDLFLGRTGEHLLFLAYEVDG